MSKQIAIIVEGERREKDYWSNIESVFFPKTSINIIPLSVEGNLYMIWKQLQEDDYNTDIIELVRERSASARAALEGYKRDDFQEIYLFFDYDPQQNNLGSEEIDAIIILKDMMETFDNETENGKLYISYPMCEALRDFQLNSCLPITKCLVPFVELIQKEKSYKKVTGISPYSDYKHYDNDLWNQILAVFLKRCGCLFGISLSLNELLKWCKTVVTPISILEKENFLLKHWFSIFILSAFPEFIIDYFSADYFKILPFISEEGCKDKDIIRTL